MLLQSFSKDICGVSGYLFRGQNKQHFKDLSNTWVFSWSYCLAMGASYYRSQTGASYRKRCTCSCFATALNGSSIPGNASELIEHCLLSIFEAPGFVPAR